MDKKEKIWIAFLILILIVAIVIFIVATKKESSESEKNIDTNNSVNINGNVTNSNLDEHTTVVVAPEDTVESEKVNVTDALENSTSINVNLEEFNVQSNAQSVEP